MTKIKHYMAAVALLGAASVGLAACGGDIPTQTAIPATFTSPHPTATIEPTVPPTLPATTGTNGSTGTGSGAVMDLLNKAGTSMQSVKSYHFVMKVETTGTAAVQADGDFSTPDSARLNMDVAGTGKVEMIVIGKDSYIKNPLGEGYVATGDAGNAGITQSLSPSQFTNFSQGSQNATVVGDETIDGASTTHVKFSYDMGKIAAQSGATGQATPPANMAVATGEAWIDKSTGYLRQFRFVSPGAAMPGTTGTATGESTTTITYSKFNEAINPAIQKPTNVIMMPSAADAQTAMPVASQMIATMLPSSSDLATTIPGASAAMTALPNASDAMTAMPGAMATLTAMPGMMSNTTPTP